MEWLKHCNYLNAILFLIFLPQGRNVTVKSCKEKMVMRFISLGYHVVLSGS